MHPTERKQAPERATGAHRQRKRGRRALYAAAATLALLSTAAPPARANGRFPRSQRLVEDPTNTDHLLLAATFGLLTTSDRGKNWYDYCEGAFAQDSTYAGDPILEQVAGGALLVDVQSSISRSGDGCGWTSTLGSLQTAATETIEDFASDSTGNTIVALVTHLSAGVVSIAIEESHDAGITWSPLGGPVPASMVFTIDLDPTDATHIYVTGLSTTDRSGIFLASADNAATWTSTAIPNTSLSEAPYIAAINPHNPEQIFVRTDSWILPDGAPELLANDALLYSGDRGATWSELLRESAKLLGFALSPDGSTILAGYGDPIEAGYDVDPTAMGIYQASMNDRQFSTAFSIDSSGNNANVTCLTWTAAGTYVCLEASTAGTYEELAFFGNGALDLDGSAPVSLMHLNEVKGPPPCCAATDAVCSWPLICQTYPFFSCTSDGGTQTLACTGPSDAQAAESGPTVSEMDATLPSDAAGNGAATTPPDGAGSSASQNTGCGCRVGANMTLPPSRVASIVGLTAYLVLWRRKRGPLRLLRR